MPKSTSGKGHPEKDRYWRGLLTGVFIGCFFVAFIIVYLVRIQGLQVTIDPKELASIAQNKVQAAASQDFPALMEEVKNDLPGEISRHMGDLSEISIGLGANKFQLPPEIRVALKKELDSIIEVAINNTINRYDTATYQKKIGSHTYALVYSMLHQDIIGKTFLLRTSSWLSFPVKIVGSSRAANHLSI